LSEVVDRPAEQLANETSRNATIAYGIGC
jgi:hypothetical protein